MVMAFFLTVSSTVAGPALAEEYYGLAMHGTPKYTADATHLDYANPNAPKGGTLTQAAIGSFDSLNPYAIKGTAAQGLAFVHDRLMARVWDEAFTLYPLIAEKVDVPDDRSSITIYLNKAAKFQDGSAITADDVIFTFETLRDYGRPNMRRVYKLVKSVDRIDDRTIKFSFGEGYDRETMMIIAMMPVLSKAWWSGRSFDSATLDVPVASGPYKITAVEPGRKIVYERDPNYWGANLPVNVGHYNFDRIVFDYYRDDSVAFESFKSGGMDLRREWDAGKWAKGYDIPAVTRGEIVKEALPHGRPDRTNALIFNTRKAPFDDIRVREALSLTLDAPWINQNMFHGLYKRIDSYYPNAELAAPATAPDAAELALLEPYRAQLRASVFEADTPDPTGRDAMLRADALLKDAGWVVKDGVRVNEKTGAPFTFEIMLSSPDDEKLALSFTRGLKRLGIDARVRVLDSAAFLGRLNEYDYDMVLYFWLSTLSPGSEQILYWGCDAAKQPARWNYAGICDPVVDALSMQIAAAKDRDGLVTAARALDRVLMSGRYMVPLFHPGVDFVARRATLKHPETMPLYGMVLETWWDESGKTP
ncbi:ABC transporter, periplasmic substrate-binding protein [Micavibrio aeruginosavorus EPB]|uniref:ABC transporter, periplasmic substrate-binding protein n=2 Tax=Micavibrio aeruginosavorus TaxID=349221 RepID=M4VWF8_9BACT|nr:ABC transporter, periplasmic substrate-binding protein [Micavibrio aeruginosavorus EPB]